MKIRLLWGVLFVVTVHGDSGQLNLAQSSSVMKRPGETVKISCIVSGGRMTSYHFSWIRQKPGKALEWIGTMDSGSNYVLYGSSFQSRFTMTEDVSSSTQFLQIQGLKGEDSAIYFCACDWGHNGVVLYNWGAGTEVEVTMTSGAPTLFPVVQCISGTGDKLTIGCLAQGFHRKNTFQWTDMDGNNLTSVQYPSVQRDDAYTGLSIVQVSKSDWNLRKSFHCSVKHGEYTESVVVKKEGPPLKVTLLSVPIGDAHMLACSIQDVLATELSVKWRNNSHYLSQFTELTQQKNGDSYSAVSFLKVRNSDWDSQSVYACEVIHQGSTHIKEFSKAPVTVTLTPPSPKEILNNNQAEYKCVVTGKDNSVLLATTIKWQIDGQPAASSDESHLANSKTSRLTMSRTKYEETGRVSCSAIGNDMTSSTQELIVNKGDGSRPKVTVYILPEMSIGQEASAEVTLVCLVSSSVQQDYYIAWTEDKGQSNGVYYDGINTPSQRTSNGHLVTSVYSTTKEKWMSHLFHCNVWTSTSFVTSQGVSQSMGNSCECQTEQIWL